MNTPETEWGSVEETISRIMKAFEEIEWDMQMRKPTTPEVISIGKSTTNLQKRMVLGNLLSSRDTYWKERHQVFVNNIIEDIENMKGIYSANDAIAKALDIIKKHTIR